MCFGVCQDRYEFCTSQVPRLRQTRANLMKLPSTGTAQRLWDTATQGVTKTAPLSS